MGSHPQDRSGNVSSGPLSILRDARLAAEHGMRLMATETALEWLRSTEVANTRRLSNARSRLPCIITASGSDPIGLVIRIEVCFRSRGDRKTWTITVNRILRRLH